ncbi:MAG: prephenate dehydrogenase/arogenate dehydrogenase family protein [Patescibacteria group bacterium]
MEPPIKDPIIGIVGGRGEMGVCFQNFFRKRGFKKILISGRHPDGKAIISNEELAQKADVVIISVTLENTVKVINEIAPLLKEDQLLIDLSSIKTPQVEAMLKSKAEVLGTHPMFGGEISFTGQVMVVCPVRLKKWKGWLEKMLEEEGIKIVELSPQEHDKRVPFLQALPHLLGFIFAEALKESGTSIDKVRELATPNAKIFLDFAARVISQNSDLVFEIQKSNPNNKNMRDLLAAAFEKWTSLIDSGRLNDFESAISKNRKFFDRFLEEGKEESKLFLETIARRNRKLEEFEKPRGKPRRNEKPSAIFGGEDSNTDMAARKFFWKIERSSSFSKYFPSIQSVFDAVKNDEARNGIVPLENETGGIIRETFDQLLKNEGKIKIRALISNPIQHVLAVSQKTDPTKIEEIYSHPQALSQCTEHILQRYTGARQISTSSTTEALDKIEHLRNAAAIGPRIAAEKRGLKIVESDFEDRTENKTTFAVIAKNWSRKAMTHTMVAFQFKNNKPGQLADVLVIFRDAAINLSKIISIPRDKNEFAFFIELETTSKAKIEAALRKAGKKSKTLFKFSNYEKVD